MKVIKLWSDGIHVGLGDALSAVSHIQDSLLEQGQVCCLECGLLIPLAVLS